MIPTLEPFNEPTLRGIAEEAVVFCKSNRGELHKTTIPGPVINQIIGDSNLNIPTVRGLILNPYIDDQGQRITEPGVHRQLLAIFKHTEFRNIKKLSPLEALIFINHVLSEFQFEGEKGGPDLKNPHRLAAIAAIMTAVQRKMLDIAPMILIQAPEFKAGKSVLTDVITAIAAGEPVPKTFIPFSRTSNDNPETGKRLETLLLKNPPAIAIDNILDGGEVQSTLLTALLTQPEYDFRRLGVHEGSTVQTNVLFIGNGRNNSISDQLASRTLVVLLAEGKSMYQRNAVTDAVNKRNEIISAVLDIIEAGLETPTTKIRGTRFKQWDKFIAAPLAFASGVDITEQFAKTEDASEQRNFNRLILQALHKNGKPMKAEELASAFNAVEEKLFSVTYEDAETWDQLFHEGLGGLLDRREDKKLLLNGRAVGRYLKPLLNRSLEIEDAHGCKEKVSLTQNGRRYYRVEVRKT
jgi:hypothetical protein